MTRFLAQKIVLPWGENSQQIQGLSLPFQSLGQFIGGTGSYKGILPFVFAAAGIGLLLMLIRSGFSFLTSAGDTKKLEQARQRLTYALVGFIVIFMAYWIVQIFGTIFGVREINTIFKR